MSIGRRSYRLGCDIGGTFTDFILVCDETGEVHTVKVLTTPDDPARAVATGLDQLATRVPGCLADLRRLIHGTTLVINAVVQRRGARTALVTTAGFRDVLAMRRHARAHIYQVEGGLPEPLIPRSLRLGLRERMLANGAVYEPLDIGHARAAIGGLVEAGIESVAVSLLHAYANPAHEQAVRSEIEQIAPELSVSISSEVLPELREFERTSTTVVNAYVKPIMRDYLTRVEEALADRGFEGQFFLMQSSGGVATTATAREHPVRVIESGPVGGVISAQRFADAGGGKAVLAFDMGGTTAKACYVEDGRLPVTADFEVDRQYRFQKGSGTPVAVPTIDLTEIGAGGGSIAAIDRLDLLQVGPQSAGADPGPACYRRGGSEPTVTDADLLLGYLNPDYFLGGEMSLDADAARSAIERAVAEPLGIAATRAAWGIHDLVNEHMAAAIRAELATSGADITRATLVATGGAGPVHAFNLARKLEVGRMLVPPNAGVASAMGLLLAPAAFDVMRSFRDRLTELDMAEMDGRFALMEEEAAAVLRRIDAARPARFERQADAAFVGQGHEIRFTLPDGPPTLDGCRAAFVREYERSYGYSYDVDVEIVTLRCHAWLDDAADAPRCVSEPTDVPVATRPAYSPVADDYVPHAVHHRSALRAGVVYEGPAIVEEPEATLVVGEAGRFETRPDGAVLVSIGGVR